MFDLNTYWNFIDGKQNECSAILILIDPRGGDFTGGILFFKKRHEILHQSIDRTPASFLA
jgi:hypothetical protein